MTRIILARSEGSLRAIFLRAQSAPAQFEALSAQSALNLTRALSAMKENLALFREDHFTRVLLERTLAATPSGDPGPTAPRLTSVAD